MTNRLIQSAGVAAIAMLGLVPVPGRTAAYLVRDIGDLGGGVCIPMAMNGVGHIAAISLNASGSVQYLLYDPATLRRAVLPWTSNGSLWYVTSTAMGLSEFGHVVSGFQPSPSYTTVHAFEWTPKGANALVGLPSELATLRGYDWNYMSWATGVNSTGTAAGWSTATPGTSGVPRAVTWSASATLPNVLPVLNTSLPSVATSISDSGTVVGYSTYATGLTVAMQWNAQGQGRNLGVLAGGSWSRAHAVDPTTGGTIVGIAEAANGRNHAFMVSASGPMVDLGVLPGLNPKYADSNALAVRTAQGAVGQASTASGALVAVLFKGDLVTDLNTVLVRAPAGLQLDYAIGIDATGRILAHGTNAQRQDRCFLLSP